MTEPPVSVRFELTADEFVGVQQLVLRSRRLGWLFASYAGLALLSVGFFVWLPIGAWAAGIDRDAFLGIAVAAALAPIWFPFVILRQQRRAWRSMFESASVLRTAVQWTVQDSGVDIAASSSNTSFTWSHFSQLIEEPKLWILMGGGAAYVIPRRAFSSDAHASAFLEVLRRKLRTSA